LFYTTCSKEYDPQDLRRLLEKIDQVDLVTGYRVGRPVPVWRRLLDFLWRGFVRVLFGMPLEREDCWPGTRGWRRRWLARWMFGVRVRDPECAFRLFRRSVFQRIPIQSSGSWAQVEIIAKANFLGCWMAEEPVTWVAAEGPVALEKPKETR